MTSVETIAAVCAVYGLVFGSPRLSAWLERRNLSRVPHA